MWPHTFGSIYTARNARVIRQNAVVLPLYQSNRRFSDNHQS
jgi:SSS family solute:Na+ symporter